MIVTDTPLAGVHLVELDRRSDSRGSFSRLFCQDELRVVLGSRQIVQTNHSVNAQVGTIRGCHFQHGIHAEMKLVTCIRGGVFDVAVDLRPESPTYLQWHGEQLLADRHLMMVIPEGCAHGFQVLEPESELIYFHTAAYWPSAEGGVRYDDPTIGIEWPLSVTEVSERDRSLPLIDEELNGLKR